jgi:uncharacterized paraquat-inducible protein A
MSDTSAANACPSCDATVSGDALDGTDDTREYATCPSCDTKLVRDKDSGQPWEVEEGGRPHFF